MLRIKQKCVAQDALYEIKGHTAVFKALCHAWR